ncbi:MAG: type II toxin-antitoxin system RelE/ParE family toxin [Pirellulales bacterium]
MRYRVRFHTPAERNLTEIVAWLRSYSPEGAARWLNRFETTIERIIRDPHVYGRAAESEAVEKDIREAFFKTPRGNKYRILFAINDRIVEILTIRSPGQNFVDPAEFDF